MPWRIRAALFHNPAPQHHSEAHPSGAVPTLNHASLCPRPCFTVPYPCLSRPCHANAEPRTANAALTPGVSQHCPCRTELGTTFTMPTNTLDALNIAIALPNSAVPLHLCEEQYHDPTQQSPCHTRLFNAVTMLHKAAAGGTQRYSAGAIRRCSMARPFAALPSPRPARPCPCLSSRYDAFAATRNTMPSRHSDLPRNTFAMLRQAAPLLRPLILEAATSLRECSVSIRFLQLA